MKYRVVPSVVPPQDHVILSEHDELADAIKACEALGYTGVAVEGWIDPNALVIDETGKLIYVPTPKRPVR